MSQWDIHGYAGRWNRVLHPNWDGGPVVYLPGCFTWNPDKIELQFMHDPGRSYGAADELGLRAWQDSQGLAFEVSATGGERYLRPSLVSLLEGIGRGSYCECSILFHIHEASAALREGLACRLVRRAEVFEITIAPQGACPDTGAWLRGNAANPELLPAKVRGVARDFYTARPLQSSRVAASSASASAPV